MKKTLTILNETGIHARPASIIAKTTMKFSSDVFIEVRDKSINAKSIMNILSSGMQKGDEITISASGSDEVEAVETLVDLFNSNFGE
ncbi:phosphocarrier protein [Acetoanaerobium pronyense]|uniref:Phosphocarrier protein HPr n=1 Tax=Acetoanaerobium pronyense TaxID=1482736 RepID=A0ABS4KNN2_9FIRM|nr:HPr family phosphocarrier protein [Acetoanaerobium pronyense]MBP2028234.1 phosphocarrier protein [Acetoanaerobium pronyense]